MSSLRLPGEPTRTIRAPFGRAVAGLILLVTAAACSTGSAAVSPAAATTSEDGQAAEPVTATTTTTADDDSTTTVVAADSTTTTVAIETTDSTTTTTESQAEPDSDDAPDSDDEGEVPLTPEIEFLLEQLELGWSEGVRCRVSDGGAFTYFEGPCLFLRGAGGSFSIQAENGGTIVDGVQIITVSIVSEGEAEVRGLTRDGVNSRWGAATRSETEPACWTGSDFEVCAF